MYWFVKKYKKRLTAIAIVVLSLFVINSHSWAFFQPNISNKNTILQVPNIFNQEQFLVEFWFIIAMALQNSKLPQINYALDECCLNEGTKAGILRVVTGPQKKGESTVVKVRILNGTYKGTIFSITLKCKDLNDLCKNPDKMQIEIITDNKKGGKANGRTSKIESISKKGESRKREIKVYEGATINEKGKIIGGHIVYETDIERKLNSFLDNNIDKYLVVTMFLEGEGGFTFYHKRYWWRKAKSAHAPIVVGTINGKANVVYDRRKRGERLYPKPEKAPKESPSRLYYVYVGAKINKSGERTGNARHTYEVKNEKELKIIIKKHFNKYIVIETVLDKNGGFEFCGTPYWTHKKGYKNVPVVIGSINGEAKVVYDKKGVELYSENSHRFHRVYTGATINEKGQKKGGQLAGVTMTRDKLDEIIGKHLEEYIVVETSFDRIGGFKFYHRRKWWAKKGYKHGIIRVGSIKGEVDVVYNRKIEGEKLYPKPKGLSKEKPQQIYHVYVGATINKKGKRKRKYRLSYEVKDEQELNKLIEKHFNEYIVVEKFLDKHGGFNFYNQHYWTSMKGYQYAPAIVGSIRGEAKIVYDKNGVELYSEDSSKFHRVYIGAKINKMGQVEEGKLVGITMSQEKLNRIIDKYRNIHKTIYKYHNKWLVVKTTLNRLGGCDFYRKLYWRRKDGYKNAPIVIGCMNGEAEVIYDRNGIRLFPAPYIYQVYLETGINENGQMREEKPADRICTNRSIRGLFREHFEKNIVIRTALGDLGELKFCGKTYWPFKKGYERRPVMIEAKNGYVIKVYSENKKLLFWDKEDRGMKVFRKLWDRRDVQNLISVFGIEGTNRILLRFFDFFNPEELLEYTLSFLQFVPASRKGGLLKRQKYLRKPKEIVDTLKTIELFQEEIERKDVEVTTDELVNLIYAHLMEKSNFLDELKKEFAKTKVSPFLEECIKIAIKHYEDYSGFAPQGFQDEIRLKLYQRMAIKFGCVNKKIILGDDPGVGKTVEALGIAANAYNGKGAQKVLIVCPCISKETVWKKEIENFLSGEQKVSIINHTKDLKSIHKWNKVKDSRFIIVNYELIREPFGDCLLEKLKSKELGIDCIILDEAHRIRNNTKTKKAIDQLDAEYKVMVTGSPLVGRYPEKLFNLFNWLYPDKYPDEKEFKAIFEDEFKYEKFKEDMKNIVIRRYMSDILPDMPKLKVEVRQVEMSKEQVALYRLMERNMYEGPAKRRNLLTLQRAAVDTALVEDIRIVDMNTGIENRVAPGNNSIVIEGKRYEISKSSREHRENTIVISSDTVEGMIKRKVKYGNIVTLNGKKYRVDLIERPSYSAKYNGVDNIVDDVVGDKMESLAIFTNIKKTVKDLKKRYEKKGYEVKCMTGDAPLGARKKLLKEITNTERPIIFICTIQTAGESVELTGIHYGLIIDEPWTAQKRIQIIRRLYRLKQTKDVHFYILQAKGTVDEEIEEFLIQGDLLQKIIFDDPKWLYFSQSDVISQIFNKDAKKATHFVLGELQKITRLYHEDEKVETEKAVKIPLFYTARKGDLYVQFKNRKFESRLRLQNGQEVMIRNIPELLEYATSIKFNKNSEQLLKTFFVQRMHSECKGKVRVKEMILWHICEELIKNFKNIDYDGNLENMVEMGTYILRTIIENPHIDSAAIIKSLPFGFRKIYEKALFYLDDADILRLFSLIEVLPQIYFHNGKILEYRSKISIYYTHEGIEFYDEKKVERIAPGWRVPESEIPKDLTGFEKDVYKVRKLDRAEEVRLARELIGHRNKVAEEALAGAHLKNIMPIARRVRSRMYRFGSKIASLFTLDELCAIGRSILVELVHTYTKLGSYKEQTFEDYLKERLAPRMYSCAYRIGKTFQIEKLAETAEQDITRPGKAGSSGSIPLEEKQTKEIVRQLMKEKGFSAIEIEIIEYFVYEGYGTRELFEWYQNGKIGINTEDDIKKIISQFRNIMAQGGRDSFLEKLEAGAGIEISNVSEEAGVGFLGKGEIDKSPIDREIKRIQDRCWEVFREIQLALIKAPQFKEETRPVDVVISLALFSRDANYFKREIEMWAYLVLLCKDIKNINFIFEYPEEIVVTTKKMPYYLESINMVDRDSIMGQLRNMIKQSAFFLGKKEIDEIVNTRIKLPRDSEEKKKNNPIEVIIISGELAEWASSERVKLEERQYPVVMETPEFESTSKKNFEAALIVGLAKASLVVARERIQQGHNNAEEEFKKLRERLVMKLNRLYEVIREKGEPIVLNEKLLNYMIDKESVHRLNRAIDFYLPSMGHIPINQQEYSHEKSLEFQYAL